MPAGGRRSDPVDPDGPRDVLQFRLAEILESEIKPASGVFLHPCRNADPARLGDPFEAGGDVDPVTEDVAILDDDVALVDADAELDAVGGRDAGVPVAHRLLHLDRATHRIDDAGEFDQHAVAGGLDDAGLVFRDLWL